MTCEHLILETIGEPYLMGTGDFIAVECVSCLVNFDVEVN
jgi:hypothetical protein